MNTPPGGLSHFGGGRPRGMALWLVPERHTGEDNLEGGAPLVLLPGATVTVGKKDVAKGDKKLSKALFRWEPRERPCGEGRERRAATRPCERLLELLESLQFLLQARQRGLRALMSR